MVHETPHWHDLDQAAWTEAEGRYFLEDGFSVVPCAHEPGGLAMTDLGWNIYAPGCDVPFAWALTPQGVALKIEIERREKLWTSPVPPRSAALWVAIIYAVLAQL